MEEISLENIAKRSIKGVLALTSRTLVLQIIGLVTSFVLTIFLDPRTFGVFFVVSAAIAFLSYFSDIGLAAALIQKKESVSKEELRVTFTIQQILVVTLVILAFLASGFIGKFYDLNKEGTLLFQALAFSFFLSSLKTIPSIILERELRFEKLVIPQIVESLFFSVTAIVLATKGFGISSFTYAVLARGLSGLIAIYIISPWVPGFAFSKQVLKKLLSFGIPFQTNSVLALIKDDLLIVYLGKVLPLSEVGFIGFAQKWALMPLRIVMDNVIRITFPSFSRLQDQRVILGRAVEKAIFASSFFIFPAIVGLIILFPYLLGIIPKYSKWEPAMLSLTFFALNALFSSISTPLTNMLNAIGKIKITLYLMIFWTLITWILTPLAVFKIGFNAVAIVSALISLSAIFVVFIVKRYVKFNLLRAIIPTIFGSLVMGVFLYLLSPIIVVDIIGFIFMIILGGIIYFLTLYLIAKKQVLEDVRIIKSLLFNK
jgi:O-antigen/teichoic acid export membrane protein